MRVASGCGTLDLTIPEDDPYLDMMAVSYDAEGRMVEVVSLSGEEITMLPLQDHTIKVLLLNKYTRAPLMPALVVSEEP